MKLLIVIGGLINMINGFLIVRYCLLRKVMKRLNRLAHGLYFHKMPLVRVWDKELFPRIALMNGDGLCHESAALTMLALKGEESSNLMIVEASNRLERGRFKHGYVEVRMYGVWWVIDYAWYMYPCIRLRVWNNFLLRIKYIRVVPYSEFWQIALANDYYDAMRKKDTSDIFWYLSAFRHIHKTQDLFDFEFIGEERFKLQAKVPTCMLHSYNIPIIPETIDELLA